MLYNVRKYCTIYLGEKLPILFIIKGCDGGLIDRNELSKYPSEHFYRVQANAWMDYEGWNFYLRYLLMYSIIILCICALALFIYLLLHSYCYSLYKVTHYTKFFRFSRN